MPTDAYDREAPEFIAPLNHRGSSFRRSREVVSRDQTSPGRKSLCEASGHQQEVACRVSPKARPAGVMGCRRRFTSRWAFPIQKGDIVQQPDSTQACSSSAAHVAAESCRDGTRGGRDGAQRQRAIRRPTQPRCCLPLLRLRRCCRCESPGCGAGPHGGRCRAPFSASTCASPPRTFSRSPPMPRGQSRWAVVRRSVGATGEALKRAAVRRVPAPPSPKNTFSLPFSLKRAFIWLCRSRHIRKSSKREK